MFFRVNIEEEDGDGRRIYGGGGSKYDLPKVYKEKIKEKHHRKWNDI